MGKTMGTVGLRNRPEHPPRNAVSRCSATAYKSGSPCARTPNLRIKSLLTLPMAEREIEHYQTLSRHRDPLRPTQAHAKIAHHASMKGPRNGHTGAHRGSFTSAARMQVPVLVRWHTTRSSRDRCGGSGGPARFGGAQCCASRPRDTGSSRRR